MDQINLTNESISIADACAFLDCQKPKLLELLREGAIPALKIGEEWVIPRSAFFQAVNDLARRSAEERRRKEMQECERGFPGGASETAATGGRRGRPPSPWNAPNVERTVVPPPEPTAGKLTTPPNRDRLMEWIRQEEEIHHRGIDVLISPWSVDDFSTFSACVKSSSSLRAGNWKTVAVGQDRAAVRSQAIAYADKLADRNEARARRASELNPGQKRKD